MPQTFDLKKYKLTIPDPTVEDAARAPMIPLTSITIRDLDGEDELAAIDRARTMAPSGRDPSATEVFEETMSIALIEINGAAPPIVPWRGHVKWKAKVRDFLRIAFRVVNDASPEDLADFRAAAVGGGGQPTRGTSSTGSGSPGI